MIEKDSSKGSKGGGRRDKGPFPGGGRERDKRVIHLGTDGVALFSAFKMLSHCLQVCVVFGREYVIMSLTITPTKRRVVRLLRPSPVEDGWTPPLPPAIKNDKEI